MKINRQLSHTIALMCSVALLFLNVFIVKCQPNTDVQGHDCSGDKYDPTSDYGVEIDKSIDNMTYSTCKKPNYRYTLTGTYSVGNAYCSVNLTPTDCTVCLEVADDYLRDPEEDCQYSVDASVILGDCGMDYAPINNGPSVA